MGNRIVEFKLSVNDSYINEEVTFNQDVTDDEIEEAYIEWRNELLYGGWSENGNWTRIE